jgi:hypothetical protein
MRGGFDSRSSGFGGGGSKGWGFFYGMRREERRATLYMAAGCGLAHLAVGFLLLLAVTTQRRHAYEAQVSVLEQESARRNVEIQLMASIENAKTTEQKRKEAFVTLLFRDSQIEDVQILVHSLSQTKTERDIVVVVSTNDVSKPIIQQLQKLNTAKTIEISFTPDQIQTEKTNLSPAPTPLTPSQSQPPTRLQQINTQMQLPFPVNSKNENNEVVIELKMLASLWTLTSYIKIFYISPGYIALHNFDPVFGYSEAAVHVEEKDELLLLISPSMATYEKMREWLGSADPSLLTSTTKALKAFASDNLRHRHLLDRLSLLELDPLIQNHILPGRTEGEASGMQPLLPKRLCSQGECPSCWKLWTQTQQLIKSLREH